MGRHIPPWVRGTLAGLAVVVLAAIGFALFGERPPPAGPPPVVDVLRIGPDGGSLISGRAEPGAAVTVRIDDAAVVETLADDGGGYVAFFTVPAGATAQALTVEARLPDGRVGALPEPVNLNPAD